MLSEVDFEHQMTPETYTRVYDVVVAAIRKVQPAMKLVGMALAFHLMSLAIFEYFLSPRNHQPEIAIDMISYHICAHLTADHTARG